MAYIDDNDTQKSNLDFIQNSMSEPILEKDFEKELALAWRDKKDEKALHKLIKSYTRLVIAIAAKYRNYGLPYGDLIQEGNLGLMLAAEKFDPDRDIRFSTYCHWWIRAQIQDYILRNWSIVRTGTTAAHKALFFKFSKLKARIEKEGGQLSLRKKQKLEIANDLSVNLRDVNHMEERLSGSDLYLDTPISADGDKDFIDMLSDERKNPEEEIIEKKYEEARNKWLEEALSKLNEREQIIIRARHLNEGKNSTLATLGEKLGVSKERIRQIEQKAFDKLKEELSNKDL